jgi:hypothetical protein
MWTGYLSDKSLTEGVLMSLQEIIAKIPSLSFDERLELAEILIRSIRDDLSCTTLRSVPASKLQGILKTDDISLSNEEIKQEYVTYLEQKYS